MKLPSPESVAAYANCSATMAAHFLNAVRHAMERDTPETSADVSDRLGEMLRAINGGQSLEETANTSEALATLARAAVSGLRLMCMNPTQRDHWRVRDDGSLWRAPVDRLGAYNRAEFSSTGEITDATPPAPEC